MTDIEIGITVVGKLYLHCVGLDKPTAFDVKNIESVEETEMGTVVMYLDKVYGDSERKVAMPFIIEEKKEDVEKAIAEAESFRDAALKAVNSMLE